MKTAWFDMDGTVVSPYFMHDGRPRIGFPPAHWRQFCRDNGDHAYDLCRPVGRVVRFARRLKELGYETRILTITLTPEERSAKVKWLSDHPDVASAFEEILFAASPDDKLRIIERAHGDDREPGSAVIVEDDYNTIYMASETWIVPVHVSHVLTGYAIDLIRKGSEHDA